MAYQRPGNQQQSSGQQSGKSSYNSKPTQTQVKPTQQAAPAAAQSQPNNKPQGKGNKPKFRLALMVDVGDGKQQTQKDEATGKTVYVGAAWENKYDGLNIKFEADVAAGSLVRAYPVEDKVQS